MRPNEKRIKRYEREIPRFNAVAYRKAWYRTGEQLKAKRTERRS